MLRVALSLYLLLLSGLSLAQYTPKKIENNDLRGKKEILSIQFLENKTHFQFLIVQSEMGQFHLEQTEDKKLQKSVKMDTESAQKIDDQFVDKFITMKYMMEKKFEKKCIETYTLFMRGEDLKVCKADTSRMSMVGEIIKLFKANLI